MMKKIALIGVFLAGLVFACLIGAEIVSPMPDVVATQIVVVGPTITDPEEDVISWIRSWEEGWYAVHSIDQEKTGETVSSYSTQYLGAVAVEIEAIAPPKTGSFTTDYDMDLLMEIFGELG